MSSRLRKSFYEQSTLDLARGLLGARLVRMVDGERLSGVIVEVEAYIGESDSACHAAKGRTARTEVMFGPPGRAYVYFTYGMHWMLNVVSERKGSPAAVLIRALEPLEGIDVMKERRGGRPLRDLTSGPARLCQALEIDRRLNGADLIRGDALFVEEGTPLADGEVLAGPRVGIDYAAEDDRAAPWRFRVKENPFVSRARGQ